MTTNPFDQFDNIESPFTSKASNPFDQFNDAGNPFGTEVKTPNKNDSDFIPGVKRGVQNLQASLYGATGLVGAGLEGLGFDETGQKLKDYGFEGYRRNVKEAKQTPAKYSFKNVYTGEAGLGGTIDWAQGVLGELVPSMAEAAVGAAVGSLAAPGPGTAAGGFTGRTILKKSIDQAVKGLVKEGTEKAVEDQIRKQVTKQALKRLGGKVGMGAAVFPMEAGSMYGDLFESHGVDAPETAMLFGALSTALEYAGGNSKLIDTFVDALAKGSKGTAKQSAKEILRNIPEEALQEGGQEVFNILNTVINTDEKLLTLDNVERIVESMAAGAVGGGAGASVQFGMEGRNFTKPSELDRQVDNIKSGGVENVQAALTDLDAKDKFANSLLNDPVELQKQAEQFDVSVDQLRENIGSQIMANNQLRERLKVELAKPTEEVQQTTEPIDIAARLDELRKQQEAKQQQINSLNAQAEQLRKEFYKSTDETVKEDLRKQILDLLTQRNALVNIEIQEAVRPGDYAEPKKADEILAERQQFWQDNWVDESNVERRPEMTDKSAQESANIIEPNIEQLDAQINQLYQQINNETNEARRNKLQQMYEDLFSRRLNTINTFEENNLSRFNQLVNEKESDRSTLTVNQQSIINENNNKINQLTNQLNTTIDRSQRISLLNQIDELNKINSGIRSGVENTAQLGEANNFDLTNIERPNIVNENLGEIDYNYLSDADLVKAINDAEIERVINQANQSMAELRQQPSAVGSNVEQTVEQSKINPNNIDVSRYTNFDENAGTPAYIITKNKTPYKNRRVLEKIIKSFPNYQNYMIVETANGFVGVRKDITDTEVKQFQNKQQTKSQNVNRSLVNTIEATPTDITSEDLNQSNIIPQFKVSEQQFKAVNPNSNQFKNWFTGSVITDENNAPLKVYHGSKTFGIDQDTQWIFNNDQGIQGTQSPMAGLGFFFATDRNEAQGYAGGGNGTIHSVYLNIKNPLIVDSYQLPQFNSREEAQAFAKRRELDGYDGIYIQDEGHYIAFRPEQIKSGDLNTGSFSQTNPDIRYQTNENPLISSVNIDAIKAAFPNQTINQSDDGTISVQFKNGKGLTIKNMQAAENGFIRYAIETGQMSKNGRILGMTIGNEILLDENFADNKTLWHENKHVLDNLGMITEADNAMLNAEFNRLRKLGKLNFALSTHENSVQRMVENRANMFAQIMVDRAAYRDKPLGKVIQRILDFFQQLFAFGQQTVAGLAQEVESGKIYNRQVNGQTYQTTVPMAETVANKWYSALENTVNNFQQKQATPDQWKGMINNFPGIKAEELDWIGLNDWLDEKQGKVSKADLLNFIKENNIQLEEVVKQESMGNTNTQYSDMTLPGGENYKELILKLPEKRDNAEKERLINILKNGEDWTPEEARRYDQLQREESDNIYSHSHWGDVNNPLAHIRFDERTDVDGNKVLFINELQSDWHQEGRRDGYKKEIIDTSKWKAVEEDKYGFMPWSIFDHNNNNFLTDEFAQTQEEAINHAALIYNKGVPNAPFKKSWPLLTMKRMIRYAAENGFDKIAWPSTPEQVAQIEEWNNIEKRGDSYFIGGDQNVTSIVNRYLQDMPRMLNKEFNRGKWGSARVEFINVPTSDGWVSGNDVMKDLKIPENLQNDYWRNLDEEERNNLVSAYRDKISNSKILSIPITDRMRSKALREGMPMFQTRETPEQKLTDEEYAQMFQQKKSVWQLYQQASKINWKSTKLLADKLFTPISTRLKEADLKFVSDELRKLDFRTSKNIIDVLKTAKPILDIANGKKDAPVKMTEQDQNLWNLARLQADTAVVQRLAEKYGMKDQVEKLRSKLDQIRTDAIDVGLDVGFVDEYWPRVLKDQAGFLQKFYSDPEFSQRPIFTEALNQKAKEMGITRDELESYPDVKADVISNVILGRPTGLGGPGNIRSRKFDTIPPEYIEFYMDADASLMQYVYSMTKKIEARRFFGAIPENIRKAKTDKTNKLKQLNKLEDFLKQGQFEDGTNPETIEAKITQLKEDISLLNDKLDKYKYSERDYSESIGAYIARLIIEGKLHKRDEQTVKDILSARFNERGTHGVINTFKNASYIDVMGNPMSALTQIGDLAWAMYVGKVWTPKGFSNTVNNLINATFNKSNVTKEDIGIERIAQEFADGTTLGNAVSNVFKIVGLTRIDSIGKETLINNSLNNYQARARSTDQNVVKQLRQELRSIFGNETEALIRELSVDKTGDEKYSDNVKYLLYSRLLDFQPAALSEMPEMYLHGGNARVFYMLKTYTLKQLDVFRNEVFHKITKGDANEKLEGIKNMIKLASLLTLANAGADELKDLLLGKEAKFSDHVVENLMTLGGASRFVKMQITREGLGSAAMQQILPPMKFVNSLSKDLMQDYADYVAGDAMSVTDARVVESLPVLGKLAYWHVGRGTEYRKSIQEQDFKKAGSEARLFKKRLENAEDKRLFLQSNLNEFKRVKIYDNIQTGISNIQRTINKLEKMEQTPNVRKRLGQLEDGKERLFQRYFDHIEQLGLN